MLAFNQYFIREVYLTDPSDNKVLDLPDYNLKVNYTLIDCTKDFEFPSNFLSPVNPLIEANSVVNIDGKGKKFVAFYEEGIHKIYNFTLSELK